MARGQSEGTPDTRGASLAGVLTEHGDEFAGTAQGRHPQAGACGGSRLHYALPLTGAACRGASRLSLHKTPRRAQGSRWLG